MGRMRILLCGAVVAVIAAGRMAAQETTARVPDWQTAAGGKASFEVASIHPTAPGSFSPPSFPMSADDSFMEPNGSFHSDFALLVLINFAYKQWYPPSQERAMLAGLPDWVKSEHFTILAKAPLGTTKDQYRLMMQDLLADRFALKVHFEEHETPALAMVLEKPGKPGPKLIPHDQGPPCDAKPTPPIFPRICYTYAARPLPDGQWMATSRATTMDQIAAFLANAGDLTGEINRSVVDQTGLAGQWDFTLIYGSPAKPGAAEDTAPVGSTLLEAMHEQLGITLKPTKAKLRSLVIDHVEQPSAN